MQSYDFAINFRSELSALLFKLSRDSEFTRGTASNTNIFNPDVNLWSVLSSIADISYCLASNSKHRKLNFWFWARKVTGVTTFQMLRTLCLLISQFFLRHSVCARNHYENINQSLLRYQQTAAVGQLVILFICTWGLKALLVFQIFFTLFCDLRHNLCRAVM